jgi:MoaA/NifB/PqqE/SkfB family radical SAM enzyme
MTEHMILSELENSDHRLPEIVDFRLLGQCDLECPYCFGPRHHLRPMPINDAISIIDTLVAMGVQSVVFSGGEPCLMKELPELIRYAWSSGLSTVLSTNGILFGRRMDELAPWLRWVGLPLDAATSAVSRLMRPGRPDQYASVINTLTEVRQRYPALGVKLGTVACALNKHDLVGIPALLGDVRPNVWKVYQVVYSTYGGDNRAILELSDEEYDSLLDELLPRTEDWGVPLVTYRRSSRPGRYLFVEPNGDALTTRIDDEVAIGNLLRDPVGVARRWKSYVDEASLLNNFKRTYPMSTGREA